ncbi:MAG: hypothetical protein ACKO40_08915 [Planctomycetaceae bacterium]
MNALPHFRGRAAPACAIRGHAYIEAPWTAVGTLRDAPPPAGAPALPVRFLRHCDEQTVVAVRAVLDVLSRVDEPPAAETCGVVAAPCQAGRVVTARSLSQLRTGGAVTVSPHIVPQCSLHSVAGAVSVALGLHGPHLGIGGGPDAVAEGVFTAASLFQAGACNACWLLISDWEQEPALDAAGEPLGDPVCRGLALLLVPESAAGGAAARITLAQPSGLVAPLQADDEPVDLSAFARAIGMCAAGAALASWGVPCPWPAQIRVEARPAVSVACRREAA